MRRTLARVPRRVAAAACAVALACGLAPTAAASGTGKPLPIDPTHRNTRAQRAAAPKSYAEKYRRNPILKEVLSEDDEREEAAPVPVALCQKFIGLPNPYRRLTGNVDQIRRDGITKTGSNAGCSTPQNETTIAVNPHNPRNLVAGANDYRVFNARENRNDGSGWAYTSLNGGRTWKNIQLPHLTYQTGATGALSYMDSAGDPVVAFGPKNTVYYGNIVFSRADPATGGTESASAITLNVSHDGGRHWGEPVVVAIDGVDARGHPTPTNVFNDKVWLAADPRNGRVYVTWTRFADQPDGTYLESPIVVAASKDYGRTFGAARRIDPTLADAPTGYTPYSQGSNPQVGRDGTLYVAYETGSCVTVACDQPTDRDVTQVATSTDHGRTFARSIVDTNFDFPLNENVGRATLTGENFRVNSYPQLAYDPDRRRLVVTWNDDRNGRYDAKGHSIRTNGDNLVSRSRNGQDWTRPTAVGTPQDEVFGAVAARKGVVAVTSYTRHYNRSGVNLDYAYWSFRSVRYPFTRIRRATSQSSDPQIQFAGIGTVDQKVLQGVFIGDYTGAALGSDLRLHPCWTDFRGRPGKTAPNQDAYTSTIRLTRRP